MDMLLYPRALNSAAPPLRRTRLENNPTLLYSWWATGCAVVIILFRLSGRWIRNEMLFREDKLMALSLIPLLIRMGLVHVILIFGTNNVQTEGIDDAERRAREIGSRLVLASRIFYAMFIWLAKLTVSEFLKRLSYSFWKKRYEWQLHAIRIFLGITFVGVFISTIAECQPFSHYWQVIPDPGPRCRQGYAQLITMGAADIITDILLIIFPIPIVLRSAMTVRRKFDLVLLFSLSTILIVITAYRVPAVIAHLGRQQYRTVWASSEILAAAAVSNAIVLGSFLRDRGVKKAKYRFNSATDSLDRPSSRRHTLTARHWGSDEDLMRDMCYRPDPTLESPPQNVARPAKPAEPLFGQKRDSSHTGLDAQWKFPATSRGSSPRSSATDLKITGVEEPLPSPREVRLSLPDKRNVSFFDVGGLLEEGPSPQNTAQQCVASGALTEAPATLPRTVHAQDHAPGAVAATAADASAQAVAPTNRRGSFAFLSEFSGRFGMPLRTLRSGSGSTPDEPGIETGVASQDTTLRLSKSRSKTGSESRSRSRSRLRSPRQGDEDLPAPTGISAPLADRLNSTFSLQDVGGLLETSSGANLGTTTSPQLTEERSTQPHEQTINAVLSSPPNRQSQPSRRPRLAQHMRFPTDISLQDVGGLLKP